MIHCLSESTLLYVLSTVFSIVVVGFAIGAAFIYRYGRTRIREAAIAAAAETRADIEAEAGGGGSGDDGGVAMSCCVE
jgi:hypothetical protein